MLKKLLEIALNVFFWAITTWFFIGIFSVETKTVEIINGKETSSISYNKGVIVQLMVLIFLCMCMMYLSQWILLRTRSYATQARLMLRTVYIPLSAIALFLLLQRMGILPARPAIPLVVSIGIFFFYYIVSMAYGAGKLWHLTEQRNKQLELEKKNAELTLLRAQLNPHFLFNVLNNLLAMIDQVHHPLVAEAIHRLSGLLRYIVYEVGNQKVPVSKEIAFIQDYIALHLLRFEQSEVRLSFDIRGTYVDQLCEPGLFIPFVENAFKYGVEPERNSEISISFDVSSAHTIKFTVVNPLLAMRHNSGRGSGIPDVIRRLHLVYPNRHIYEQSDINNKYFVSLEINTDENNHS